MHPRLHRGGGLAHDRGVRPLPHVALVAPQGTPRGPLVGVPLAPRPSPRFPSNCGGDEGGRGRGVPAVGGEDVGMGPHNDVLGVPGGGGVLGSGKGSRDGGGGW